MGVGFAGSLDVSEGFGILAMASIGPLLAVLTTGLWVNWKREVTRRREAREAKLTVKTVAAI